jgi:small subunit ribosomal protein S9
MNIDLTHLEPIAVSIGRRKEAVAYVKLYENNGISDGELHEQCFINGQLAGIYFQFDSKSINKICLPFYIIKDKKNFILNVTVRGGGLSGQVEATKLAVSRALSNINNENRILLKTYGFLTRDSRIKESKKYGLKKARKASQYSKR